MEESFGSLIKRKRIELGMTQLELAAKLDISRSTVLSWECSKQTPISDTNSELLNNASDVLGVTRDKLYESLIVEQSHPVIRRNRNRNGYSFMYKTKQLECSLNDCNNSYYRYGLCKYHYDLNSEIPVPICMIDDCNQKLYGKSLCSLHYKRWWKYGDPKVRKMVQRDLICLVEGCEQKHNSLGFCNLHYKRFKKYGDPLTIKEKPICSIMGCDNPHKGHGFCTKHYQRFKRNGDPLIVSKRK